MNVEQRIAALEALLEKVQKNAAAPRPERVGLGSLIAKPGDDVVGPAIPAISEAATPIVTKKPDLGEDLWDDGPTKDAPPPKAVAIAAPLPGLKEGTPKTPPAAAAKPITTAAKPAVVPGPKPITPVTTAAKPAPIAAKPPAIPGPKPITPVTTAAKPAVTPAATAAKPAAAMPKLTATPIVTKPAAKPVDELKRTIPGVGDGEEVGDSRPAPLQDTDAITAPMNALAPEQVEALLGTEKKPETTSTGLPSAIDADADIDDAEPTKLFEPASTSKPSAALAAALAKTAEPEKKPESVRKPEPEKPTLETKPEPEAAIELEIEAAAPEKKPEITIEPEAEKKPEPEAAIEIEAAAPEKKPESVRKPEPEKKPEPEPEASIELGAAELEPKPEPEKKPTAKPPLPTKKPVDEAKPIAKPEKKPVVAKPVPEPEETKPEPKKGLPGWLLVAAALLLIGAGAFVAMQKGWIPGLPGTTLPGNPGGAVTPPPTPTPTETVQAAPTPTDTAAAAPTATDTAAAPPGSASAAPAGSASAGPEASAAPTAEAPPAKDPATLPPTRGILTVTSNKEALVFLTGKLVGSTGEAVEVDCGPKFLRLAEPGETNPVKAKWLTPGESRMINCQKANDMTINVP
ncbi:hypothetical protein [Polyangium spumosum]|uniref:Uncharacterized protein n=1 Tax=Polyangium spumosum TaxID=889282 RepID=A0A6N7PNG9_9BACT|nr:hypothetical protein [Polyangium spumosum]MRG91675.1 hypothetical protein [Polyangium spumosum]